MTRWNSRLTKNKIDLSCLGTLRNFKKPEHFKKPAETVINLRKFSKPGEILENSKKPETHKKPKKPKKTLRNL